MKHVAIIGAGVVGLTTARALLDAGFGVTLIERAGEVAQGASHANGGQLSYRYVAPLADAGVPFKALGWMFKADSPQQFRPELSLRQWSWMASFLAHCTRRANQRTTRRMRGLGRLSQERFDALRGDIALQDIALRAPGKLVVFRRAEEFARAATNARADADSITAGEVAVLDADACVTLEPALADARHLLAGGIYTRSEAVADCRLFCDALRSRLEQHRDFRLLRAMRAEAIRVAHGRAVAVLTEAGDFPADAVVLAAGLGSQQLAASAGIRLPLYPIKGYSLSAPIGGAHRAPEVSVTDFEQKVLYARIGEHLRVAAMADLVGDDERVDPARVASLQRVVRATLPNAADFDHAAVWAGLRPATPAGTPILGATPVRDLWLNVGHGALGFTLAAGSATILADLIAGRPAPIPLEGFTLQ